MSPSLPRRGAAALAAAALAAAAAGCTYIAPTAPPSPRPSENTLYQRDVRSAALEVPPDLSRVGVREAYPIPGARFPDRSVDSVLPEVPDMRVERDGELRWLVVDAPPDDLWRSLGDFWRAQGFRLEVDSPQVGVMETGWAEKRVDLPVGGVRRMFARFKRLAYRYSERDRFRTRIERTEDDGAVAIYVAHRGVHEVVRGDTYAWEPREPDAGLEAEMLGRLRLYLARGEAPEAAAAIAAAGGAVAPSRADLVKGDADGPYVRIGEGFDRSWRLVGIALDRGGFTVIDLDRSDGVFLVRYVDPETGEPEKRGFFSRLAFWSRPERKDVSAGEADYRVVVERGDGPSTRVVVQDAEGVRDASESAGRILTVLAENIE